MGGTRRFFSHFHLIGADKVVFGPDPPGQRAVFLEKNHKKLASILKFAVTTTLIFSRFFVLLDYCSLKNRFEG
jgi:hypothetical protein